MCSNNYEIARLASVGQASSLEGFAMTMIFPSVQRRGLRGAPLSAGLVPPLTGVVSWLSGPPLMAELSLAPTPFERGYAVRINPDSHTTVITRSEPRRRLENDEVISDRIHRNIPDTPRLLSRSIGTKSSVGVPSEHPLDRGELFIPSFLMRGLSLRRSSPKEFFVTYGTSTDRQFNLILG